MKKSNFKYKKVIVPIIMILMVTAALLISVIGYRYYRQQELQKNTDTDYMSFILFSNNVV